MKPPVELTEEPNPARGQLDITSDPDTGCVAVWMAQEAADEVAVRRCFEMTPEGAQRLAFALMEAASVGVIQQ